MGRVLGACRHGVLEALQGFADRVGHGDVEEFARVVTFDGKPVVLAVRCVDGDEVILLELDEEVRGIVCGKELNTKVIYSKGEGGRQGCMRPKNGGVRHRIVAMGVDILDKGHVVNDDVFL